MSFFTIGWEAPANIGWLPQHPGDGEDPFFTIGWTPKQSATYYPYSTDGLTVTPGVPDPPPETGGGGGGGGGGGTPGAGTGGAGTPAPPPLPPAVLRPHVIRAIVAARKDPRLFRKSGLALKVQLDAPGLVTIDVYSVAGHHKLAYSKTRQLPAGITAVTLRPSLYGQTATRRHTKVSARVVVTVVHADRAKATASAKLTFAPPPKKKKRSAPAR
jgi:hypothetical protein